MVGRASVLYAHGSLSRKSKLQVCSYREVKGFARVLGGGVGWGGGGGGGPPPQTRAPSTDGGHTRAAFQEAAMRLFPFLNQLTLAEQACLSPVLASTTRKID
jgi:hypothetical protein